MRYRTLGRLSKEGSRIAVGKLHSHFIPLFGLELALVPQPLVALTVC